jgi:Ca2+-binding EF-hand superfamily protein
MTVTGLNGGQSSARSTVLRLLSQSAPSGTGSSTAAQGLPQRVAMAPPPPSNGADAEATFEALVKEFDTDGDGGLSASEVQAFDTEGVLGQTFAEFDSDASGTLSAAEIEDALPPPPAPPDTQGRDVAAKFSRLKDEMDANGDGVITTEELAAAQGTKLVEDFSEVDSNGDGAVNEQEFAAFTPIDPADSPASLMESLIKAMASNGQTSPTTADQSAARQLYSLIASASRAQVAA